MSDFGVFFRRARVPEMRLVALGIGGLGVHGIESQNERLELHTRRFERRIGKFREVFHHARCQVFALDCEQVRVMHVRLGFEMVLFQKAIQALLVRRTRVDHDLMQMPRNLDARVDLRVALLILLLDVIVAEIRLVLCERFLFDERSEVLEFLRPFVGQLDDEEDRPAEDRDTHPQLVLRKLPHFQRSPREHDGHG